MRKSDVIGRRIVGVAQSRVWNKHLDRFEYILRYLTLDNGSRISLDAVETEDCPIVTADVIKG